MGILPVAPRRSRLLELGERKLRGLREKPVDAGFRRSDKMYIPALSAMMYVRIRSALKIPPARTTFFQREPGWFKPQ
jgi:hypothetical protein